LTRRKQRGKAFLDLNLEAKVILNGEGIVREQNIQGVKESFSSPTYQVDVGPTHDGGKETRKSRRQRRTYVWLKDYQLEEEWYIKTVSGKRKRRQLSSHFLVNLLIWFFVILHFFLIWLWVSLSSYGIFFLWIKENSLFAVKSFVAFSVIVSLFFCFFFFFEFVLVT